MKIHEPVDYRPGDFFSGRHFRALDPGSNCVDRRDQSWKLGMSTPTYEDIVTGMCHETSESRAVKGGLDCETLASRHPRKSNFDVNHDYTTLHNMVVR